ncbi:MAG: hypothetical protein GXP25_21385 [Planctomycetes bacterium]|nr:hypothetical protein [Planctomycetota bacterium]
MKKDQIRKEADLLLQDLPEETSWDDLMYRIYVRQKIEKGLKDSENGRLRTTDELRKKHLGE